MEAQNATEAATSAAAVTVGWKLVASLASGGAVAIAAACVIVMSMVQPRTRAEWAVALTSTVASSIFGGAWAVHYLGLQNWIHTLLGAVMLISIVFACGLPGWFVVRVAFNWMQRRQDKEPGEVIADLRKLKE